LGEIVFGRFRIEASSVRNFSKTVYKDFVALSEMGLRAAAAAAALYIN
jgi:hypothetical protein